MESRIEAMRRLQRENRWAEASRSRDEYKQRLRREGMNRRDANDASWTWMISAYSPKGEAHHRPDAETSEDQPAKRDGVPRYVDQDDMEPFVLMHWVHGMLKLMGARKAERRPEAENLVDVSLLSCCPIPSLAYVGIMALTEPMEYLDACEKKFRTALARIAAEEPGHWLQKELETCIAELPTMRRQLSSSATRERAGS